MTHRSFAAFLVALTAVSVAGSACSATGEAAATADRLTRTARDSTRADSVARSRQDSINRTLPGYVVDSILPEEEQLRRFREAVGGSPVTGLAHASPSRDALVRRFVRAVGAADSSELTAMALDAREFADLVYPESPSTSPPYRQDPSLVWRTVQNPSASGLRRLLRRAGGKPVTLVSYRCEATPHRQGRNVLWSGCRVRLADAGGDTATHRLFGTIIEREGRFKFIGYSNEF